MPGRSQTPDGQAERSEGPKAHYRRVDHGTKSLRLKTTRDAKVWSGQEIILAGDGYWAGGGSQARAGCWAAARCRVGGWVLSRSKMVRRYKLGRWQIEPFQIYYIYPAFVPQGSLSKPLAVGVLMLVKGRKCRRAVEIAE